MQAAFALVFLGAAIYAAGSRRGGGRGNFAGEVVRVDVEAAARLLPQQAMALEVVARGFSWAEGPLWLPANGDEGAGSSGSLLFSDVKANTLYEWREDLGLRVVATPSGLPASQDSGAPGTPLLEPGTNGLALTPDGQYLVACDHGGRRVIAVPLSTVGHMAESGGGAWPRAAVRVLADRYDGARLNSPNDAVFAPNGDLLFTDPSYGLQRVNAAFQRGEDSPDREQADNRVYRVPADAVRARLRDPASSGEASVELATSLPSPPNGIAVSSDRTAVYVANSNKSAPIIQRFSLAEQSQLQGGETFFDATALKERYPVGNPDGLAVDSSGNVWATGPGGVHVVDASGRHIASLLTGTKTGNVAFGGDGHLYVTANDMLLRVPVLVEGALNWRSN